MKYLAAFLITFFLLVSQAFAVTPTPTTVDRMIGLGMRPELAEFVASMSTVKSNAEWLRCKNYAGTGDLLLLRGDTSDNTMVNAASTKSIRLAIAVTPAVDVSATGVVPFADDTIVLGSASKQYKGGFFSQDTVFAVGASPRIAAYVPTMAATPVAGTNDFKLGLNIVPTAAANTAGIMPTPAAAGQPLEVYNNAGAAVRVKAGGTNTINGSAGGGYIPLAVQGTAKCRSLSTSAWACGTEVVPTPAGP